MPLIVEFKFADGSSDIQRIRAEIWAKDSKEVTKVFRVKNAAVAINLDPYQETADVDMDNNTWPTVSHPSRFQNDTSPWMEISKRIKTDGAEEEITQCSAPNRLQSSRRNSVELKSA